MTGANFALNVKGAKLTIKINSGMTAKPAGWTAYRAALLAAKVRAPSFEDCILCSPCLTLNHSFVCLQPTSCPSCDAWLASLYSTPGLNPVRTGLTESVSFAPPPGFGPAAEVIVVVDGVPSDVNATFTYDAPTIFNLGPNRVNTSEGFLNVVIDGASLCASTACGRVVVNNVSLAPASIKSWSHTQIVINVTDPGTSSLPQSVQVVVGGIASNTLYFLKPVP